MFTKNIIFKNFIFKKKKSNTKSVLNKLISSDFKNKNNMMYSLNKNYKYSFSNIKIAKLKKFNRFKLIGMGGSILGAEAIYQFLNKKIKKIFTFYNNLSELDNLKKNKECNLIISKSGNTLELITNFNLLNKKGDKNVIITEKKNSYLFKLANELKYEIIEHKNYIGGRYSVLSEVGMLPSELMGLNIKKLKD